MRGTAEHLETDRRWRVSYRGGGRDLAGFWLTPDGDGPHPAVAVAWVAARPEVDAGRSAVAGSSFGGVLTVLALSEPAPLRAG